MSLFELGLMAETSIKILDKFERSDWERRTELAETVETVEGWILDSPSEGMKESKTTGRTKFIAKR